MKYIIILVVLTALVLGIYIYRQKRMVPVGTNVTDYIGDGIQGSNALLTEVKVKKLPAKTQLNGNELIEITDKSVLARLDNVVSEMGQAGLATKDIIKGIRSKGKNLYEVIIPPGAELSKSKDMEGAVRGMFHGDNGIQGHANLIKASETGVSIANVTAAAMGIASVIVGQYYMKEVNSKLSDISSNIDRVADFQDMEFKSKVLTLVIQIKKSATFQSEILNDEEMRRAEITKLDSFEHESTELLTQATLSLSEYADRNCKNYKEYEKMVSRANKWHQYQQILLDVIKQIAQLKYALYMGRESKKQCNSIVYACEESIAATKQKLIDWHDVTAEKLGIDINEERRKREGIDEVVHFIPGLFKEGSKYRSMDAETVEMIEKQSEATEVVRLEDKGLYEQNTNIVVNAGKYYYWAK